ncbi:PQQ-binding-like beta-propeller repeat protein [Rosistilla oblonga]|uniref:outer membrane protein assembly factor BamB family protein n=1 Tax=Rosistilla oblonga TaxID=2527990 RepID=UPI003A96F22E
MSDFHRFSLPLGLLVSFAAAIDAVAAPPSWPEFQNGGQAVAAEVKLPTHWAPDQNIAWTADIVGYGQSAPIVAHDQIVVTSTSGENKDDYHVSAYDFASGNLRWQVDLKNPSPFKNTPMVSRAAPTAIATDTGYIAFFEGGALIALSPEGKTLWQKDLVAEYGKIEARHGLSASLEQNNDLVFVWVERGEEPYILALNKTDGEVVWKAPGVGSTSWASPRLIPVGSSHQLVCSASGKIVGLDPASGDRLWEFSDISNNTSCTPMPVGDGQFLIGASDGRGETAAGAAAASNGLIEISKGEDGKFTAAYKWQAKKATSTFGSPVVAGDTAAIVNRTGVLYRLDLQTGDQVSIARTAAGGIWATPIVAGDRIYLFGNKGTTSVVSLTDGKEIASNRCWDAEAESGEGVRSGSVLYAAAVAPPYLILRRGDKLYAVSAEDEK